MRIVSEQGPISPCIPGAGGCRMAKFFTAPEEADTNGVIYVTAALTEPAVIPFTLRVRTAG